jgi:hypothetical protein
MKANPTMTITLDPISAAEIRPADTTTPRRAWARIGAATGILAAVTFFGFGSLPVEQDALADNALVHQAVLDKEIVVWLFQTSTVLLALGLVIFGAGLHRRLVRHEPADSLVPLVAVAGVFLTAALTLAGGGIGTEMFWSLVQDADKVDPDTIAAQLTIYDTLAWVWAGLGLTMGAVAWSARTNPGIPRWIGRVSIAGAALVALVQILPFQYMAVLPGLLWLVAVGVGFARTEPRPA